MKLTTKDKEKIMHSIFEAEHLSSGEIRVHVSHASKDENVLQSAQTCFQKLKMHETTHRNGMLLYVNPKQKKFAVFGDQGIHEKVGQKFWNELVVDVQKNIREKNWIEGVVHAVHRMGTVLKKNFPNASGKKDELSNEVTESD